MGPTYLGLCWQMSATAGRELIHVLHVNEEKKCRRKWWLPGAGEKRPRHYWSTGMVEVLLELLLTSLLEVIGDKS